MSKNKRRIIATSPALYPNGDKLRTDDGEEYLCLRGLRRRFELPDPAETVWLQASRTQWPDGSGLRCGIRLRAFSEYWDEVCSECLLTPPCKDLERVLGLDPDERETIYICVFYEE